MTARAFIADPTAHVAHELHRTDRSWPETNCYVDLWIELLHGLGLDPVAAMAFTVAMDFEGDQWTFFKPPLADLNTLYGVDVQELTIWRPLALQVAEQVARSRVVLVEVDSYFLPDTVGVSYGIEHTKTTIGVSHMDLDARRLSYFHNAGYFALEGDDFDGALGGVPTGGAAAPCGFSLPPYTEIVKLDGLVRRSEDEVTGIALASLRDHLRRRPKSNPVTRYRARLASDMDWLSHQDMSVFHQYAFATLRQCGSCAEMASTFLTWLGPRIAEDNPAASDFATIATSAKAVQFKIARMVATKKPAFVDPILEEMEGAWQRAMSDLASRYGA